MEQSASNFRHYMDEAITGNLVGEIVAQPGRVTTCVG